MDSKLLGDAKSRKKKAVRAANRAVRCQTASAAVASRRIVLTVQGNMWEDRSFAHTACDAATSPDVRARKGRSRLSDKFA